jgi:hypothetical protein
MATPATAPGQLGVPATAIKQDPGAQKQQKQQAVLKVFPAASPWLKQIPHPKDAKVPTQVCVTLCHTSHIVMCFCHTLRSIHHTGSWSVPLSQ